MNKKYLTLILVGTILSVTTAKAQRWNNRKYELFYGIGASNFMGDIMSPIDRNVHIWAHFFNTISPIANAGLRYNIQQRHYATATCSLGQLYAKEMAGNSKYYYRGLKFSTVFLELAARYEFLVFKEKRRRTVYRKLGDSKLKNFSLPTYAFIGVGALVNGGKVTHNYDIHSDEKRYVNVAAVIPYGLGVKFRIKNYTYINLEAGARLALSDGIDYIKKDNFSNITGGSYIDQYGFLTINMIRQLGVTRKGLPKFKRR